MAAASPLHPPLPPLRFSSAPRMGRWGDPLLAVVLVLFVLLGTLTVRDTLAALAPEAPAPRFENVDSRVWHQRVVPVEWRWAPEGVDVDRMFRRSR